MSSEVAVTVAELRAPLEAAVRGVVRERAQLAVVAEVVAGMMASESEEVRRSWRGEGEGGRLEEQDDGEGMREGSGDGTHASLRGWLARVFEEGVGKCSTEWLPDWMDAIRFMMTSARQSEGGRQAMREVRSLLSEAVREGWGDSEGESGGGGRVIASAGVSAGEVAKRLALIAVMVEETNAGGGGGGGGEGGVLNGPANELGLGGNSGSNRGPCACMRVDEEGREDDQFLGTAFADAQAAAAHYSRQVSE